MGSKTALKYLTNVKQAPFPETVRLLNEGKLVDASFQHVPSGLAPTPAEPRMLQLPQRDAQSAEMPAYLRK